MNTFIFELCELLNLTKPVEIKLVMYRKSRDWSAIYKPKYNDCGALIKHCITISLEKTLDRSMEALIAHELIHAWQEENSVADYHGKPFQKMARKISRSYPRLTDIYISNLDD